MGQRNQKSKREMRVTQAAADLTDRQGYVYVLRNLKNGLIYTGVTIDIKHRVMEHRQMLAAGCPAQFDNYRLVYFEVFNDILEASSREKEIQAISRSRKLGLVQSMNPDFEDLQKRL